MDVEYGSRQREKSKQVAFIGRGRRRRADGRKRQARQSPALFRAAAADCFYTCIAGGEHSTAFLSFNHKCEDIHDLIFNNRLLRTSARKYSNILNVASVMMVNSDPALSPAFAIWLSNQR